MNHTVVGGDPEATTVNCIWQTWTHWLMEEMSIQTRVTQGVMAMVKIAVKDTITVG